jgi:tetratricopeptide (TPR) repeat protein
MIRLAWKQILTLGFIFFILFSGCAKREATIEERITQAEELLNVGQIDGAILLLEKALEQDPRRVDVMEPLAFAYAANQDPMLAAMTFMRIAELVPDQPEYLIYAAESLIEAGDATGAIEPYRDYLVARPSDRAVWTILAELHKEAGRSGESLEAYLASEQLESKAATQIEIGSLYLQSQNLAQAQSWFARALEGDSDSRDEALLGLLETAIRSKRFMEANALVMQLDAEYPGRLEQSPMDSVRDQLAEWTRRREAAKAALAALEAKREEEKREAQQVEEVSTDIPETEEPPSGEVVALMDPEVPAVEQPAEEPREAQAQQAEQSSALSQLALARQNRETGQVEEAIRLFKQVLIENDNQPGVWAELSELYLQTGRDRWAQATASEAVRRDPENPQLVLQFLRAAEKTMDVNRLVREMENIYRKFPGEPDVLLAIGRIFADQGNARNALILYEKFLGVAPIDHPERPGVQAEVDFLGE